MSKFLDKSNIKHQLKEDGMEINGNSDFIGGEFESFDDHRIAMSIAISSIVAKNNTIITVSYTHLKLPTKRIV